MGGGKKYQPEQVVNLLEQIEVAVVNAKTREQASKEVGTVEQTYFHRTPSARDYDAAVEVNFKDSSAKIAIEYERADKAHTR